MLFCPLCYVYYTMETIEDLQRQKEFIDSVAKIYQNDLAMLKPYLASQIKDKSSSNKIAKQYNLFSKLTNTSPKMSEDVSSGTEGLRFFSGSINNNKVQKTFDLIRMITGT